MLKPVNHTANKIISKIIEKEKELYNLHHGLFWAEGDSTRKFEMSKRLLEVQAQRDILNKLLPELMEIIKEEQ